MHLIIDGKAENAELMASPKALELWLLKATELLGMQRIGGPWVIQCLQEPLGLSGVIIFAESGINVHTFWDRQSVGIDIHSCKSFDAETVAAQISKEWRLVCPVIQVLERYY